MNMSVREGSLFGLGNPLLDIQAEVSEEFLKKYDLEANNAILADEKHKNMYDDMVDNFKVEFIPGGACQNTIRVAQWLLGVHHATTFTGCISKDKYGEILERKTKEAGVKTAYVYTDKEPTGTCAVMITGQNRSLCAYLAAANYYTIDHLKSPEIWRYVEMAKFYYTAGFPLTVCPDALMAIAQHSSEHGKMFCMNLSAPFLCTVFREPLMKLMPYVDFLFGNETEALTFAKEHNYNTTDIAEIATKIASLPKSTGLYGRRVIITQGPEPTIVVSEGRVKIFPAIHIDPKDIVDTNGAGDAFCGGFLAGLVQGQDLAECIRLGHYTGNLIIQRSGCTYPEQPAYKTPYF